MRTPRPGDRIRITGIMADDPAPLPIGASGTVTRTGPGQIHVDWDNGRTLILLDTDPYEITSTAPPNDDNDTHRAAPTDSLAHHVTVPAGTLRGGQRLDNGKYVRAVVGSGGVVDIAFSDGTQWCSVPEIHPITLWHGRPSTRAYPFTFLAPDEHPHECPNHPH